MLEADSISGPFSLFKSKLKQESGKKNQQQQKQKQQQWKYNLFSGEALFFQYSIPNFTARCYAKRGLRCRKMAVRLSVCLFVTRRYSVETAKRIIKLFPPSGSHTILVFRHQMVCNIPTESPNGGVKCRGYEKNRDFRPIRYLTLSRKW